MELKQVVEKRRSIRKFKTDKVSEEILKQLIETAKFAPSWKNTQVTRYYAVIGEQVKEKIVEALPDFNKPAAKSAPVLIVSSVVKGRSGYNREGEFDSPKGKGWQMYDCASSNLLFCLAATEVGLGTVIMGLYEEEKIEQAIALPSTEEIISVIAIGYPDECPIMPKRKDSDMLLTIIE